MYKLSYLLLIVLLIDGCTGENRNSDCYPSPVGVHKLLYNNPGLVVDLDGGFKTIPMPMDFDGDGDLDLLVSESGAYAEAGVFYFENVGKSIKEPLFRRGDKMSIERRRLAYDGSTFQVSHIDGRTHVIASDMVREKLIMYEDVPQNVFWASEEIELPAKGYEYLHNFKYSKWKMVDFDGDGIYDLVCAVHSPSPIRLRGEGEKERTKSYNSFKKRHSQLIFLKNTGSNDEPLYANPVEILKDDGTSLAKGIASVDPIFADFDNDGDLDFIGIGRSMNGEEFDVTWDRNFFLFFENTGTKTDYKFTTGKVITHNGKPVKMESRATIYLTAVDFDKDGFVDLLGGDEGGRIAILKNIGIKDGLPQFLPPSNLQQEAKYVDFGALAAPRVFDWDGDGLDDIICGNGIGNVGFFKNLGGNIPKWDAPKNLEVDGKPLRIIPNVANPNTEEPIWGYTTIDVGYWDEDKLPDILVNNHNGNVVWLRNTGSRTNPKLAEPIPVEVDWQGEPQKPKWTPGVSKGNELLAPWRTSPLIMDFNKDGLNDLVMLDFEGYLAVYMRYRNSKGELRLKQPERSFIYENGEPVLLNQRKGKSNGRLKITFVDWDGDGDKDLVFSSKPAVDWMRNEGVRDGKMVLKYMGRVVSRTLMGHTDGPTVADWNRDGVPDLVVGTETGTLYYWVRPGYDVTTTMTTAGKQQPANYLCFKR